MAAQFDAVEILIVSLVSRRLRHMQMGDGIHPVLRKTLSSARTACSHAGRVNLMQSSVRMLIESL